MLALHLDPAALVFDSRIIVSIVHETLITWVKLVNHMQTIETMRYPDSDDRPYFLFPA